MEITRHWRLKAQRYRLEGSACPVCGQLIFPPRPVCAKCHCSTQSARIAVLRPTALPISIDITDLEAGIRYQIMERMIR